MARHVTIGPDFFAKAKYDYSDWRWAIIREFFQNSMDCGSSRIEVHVEEVDGKQTVLTVTNDGRPMTEDIVVNKLLSLGGSAKNFQDGNVGGFGKAKEILYFCHDQYTITTGNLIIDGSGSTYNITETPTAVNGTTSKVLIAGLYSSQLLQQIDLFIKYAQWPGTFVVNGTEFKADLRKGSPRLDLEYGTVYVNNSHPRKMIVRINGIPMFTKSIGVDKCVVVELKGASSNVLNSNRDGLKFEYSTKLNEFVTQLSVDSKSALRRYTPQYTHFLGDRLIAQIQAVDVSSIVLSPKMEQAAVTIQSDRKALVEHTLPQSGSLSNFKLDFIVKNMVNMTIPNCYIPGSGLFSEYSTKLTRIWGRILVQLHRQFNMMNPFSVGFIFDNEIHAEYESGQFGRVYYLNPVRIVTQANGSRSFSKKYKLTDRDRLIVLATHELVHGMGFQYHDEQYANMLTDVFSDVMRKRSTFNWCFK